jgi:hypothetical protein
MAGHDGVPNLNPVCNGSAKFGSGRTRGKLPENAASRRSCQFVRRPFDPRCDFQHCRVVDGSLFGRIDVCKGLLAMRGFIGTPERYASITILGATRPAEAPPLICSSTLAAMSR